MTDSDSALPSHARRTRKEESRRSLHLMSAADVEAYTAGSSDLTCTYAFELDGKMRTRRYNSDETFNQEKGKTSPRLRRNKKGSRHSNEPNLKSAHTTYDTGKRAGDLRASSRKSQNPAHMDVAVTCSESNPSFEQNELSALNGAESVTCSQPTSESTSEYEFNFQEHIHDTFQTINEGLFKIKLNDAATSNESAEAIKPASKHASANNGEEKNKLIKQLRRQIKDVTAKCLQKEEQLEAVQKENFDMEQIYKNRYYVDMQKERGKYDNVCQQNSALSMSLSEYKKCMNQVQIVIQRTLECFGNFPVTRVRDEQLMSIKRNLEQVDVLIGSVGQKIDSAAETSKDQITPRFITPEKRGNTSSSELGRTKHSGTKNGGSVKNGRTSKTASASAAQRRTNTDVQRNLYKNFSFMDVRSFSKNSNKNGNKGAAATNNGTKHKETDGSKLTRRKSISEKELGNNQLGGVNKKNPNKKMNPISSVKRSTVGPSEHTNKKVLEHDHIIDMFNKTRKFKYMLQSTLNAERSNSTRSSTVHATNQQKKDQPTSAKGGKVYDGQCFVDPKPVVSIFLSNEESEEIRRAMDSLKVRNPASPLDPNYLQVPVNDRIHNQLNPENPKKVVSIHLNSKKNANPNVCNINASVVTPGNYAYEN